MLGQLKSIFNFKYEVNFYRFLFLMGGTFYYAFYHIFTWLGDGTYEIWQFRLSFALIMVGTSIASFYIKWIERNIVKIAYVESSLIAIAFMWLLWENNLSLSYAFRYTVLIGIAIVFKETLYMFTYLAFCAIASCTIALLLDNPGVPPKVFITASIAPTIVFSVCYYSRIVLLNRLQKEREHNTQKEKKELEFAVMENRQNALSQQMNPHFISNALNAIQYYILKNDKVESINYLGVFASLMRNNLENSQFREIPIYKEIDTLKAYLTIEQMRFNNQFDFEIKVSEKVDKEFMLIPPLLLQPYAENAIIHGFTQLKDKGKLDISIDVDEQYGLLVCKIEDNGIGLSLNKRQGHNSLGTKITKSRINIISQLYGKEIEFVMKDKSLDNSQDHGVLIEMRLPIIEGIPDKLNEKVLVEEGVIEY